VDALYFVERILKEIRKREDDLTEILKTGGVQDWNSYQRVLGELAGLSSAERIIIDLQNVREQVNDS
jgi:hypothetical protein